MEGGVNIPLTVKDQFTLITRRAFEQMLNERINERLKGAMTQEAPLQLANAEAPAVEQADESGIVTTPEEIEGFHIVRSILRGVVSSQRVVMRDALSYCAILLDDNNRKPICRLRFNNTEKLAIGLFNEKKEEERISLSNMDSLYDYAERLRATVLAHLPVVEK
jgi:hypothetical protein